ncbi:MAG: hypothetical protein D6744_09225 [Planctomycetota bacterium]|nr:MAG: hypothetical protein D6744_09225 [Planctomycetota bacterium]
MADRGRGDGQFMQHRRGVRAIERIALVAALHRENRNRREQAHRDGGQQSRHRPARLARPPLVALRACVRTIERPALLVAPVCRAPAAATAGDDARGVERRILARHAALQHDRSTFADGSRVAHRAPGGLLGRRTRLKLPILVYAFAFALSNDKAISPYCFFAWRHVPLLPGATKNPRRESSV